MAKPPKTFSLIPHEHCNALRLPTIDVWTHCILIRCSVHSDQQSMRAVATKKTASREFPTSRFTPKKTRFYGSKKNPTITQWKPSQATQCEKSLLYISIQWEVGLWVNFTISSCVMLPGGSKFNTATLWFGFLVRASIIGPIQWGVGWLPIHNQFVFYGLGTLGLEHLRGWNMLKHVFAVKPQFELQLTNFWLCCCKIRCCKKWYIELAGGRKALKTICQIQY